MSTSLACSQLFSHWASLHLWVNREHWGPQSALRRVWLLICPDKNRKRREIRGKLAASSPGSLHSSPLHPPPLISNLMTAVASDPRGDTWWTWPGHSPSLPSILYHTTYHLNTSGLTPHLNRLFITGRISNWFLPRRSQTKLAVFVRRKKEELWVKMKSTFKQRHWLFAVCFLFICLTEWIHNIYAQAGTAMCHHSFSHLQFYRFSRENFSTRSRKPFYVERKQTGAPDQTCFIVLYNRKKGNLQIWTKLGKQLLRLRWPPQYKANRRKHL